MPQHAHRPPQQASPQTAPPDRIQEEVIGSNHAAMEQMQGQEHGRVGGFLSQLIRDNLGAEDVDDAVTGGVDSGADWLKDTMVDAASDEDRAIAREHGGAGVDQVRDHINGSIRGSQLGESVADFAADRPFLTTGLGAAAAAGYILSDQELKDIGTDFRIGDHHRLGVSGDFGSTLDPSFDAVRGSYTYDDGVNRAQLQGGTRFDRDEWDVSAMYRRQLGEGRSATIDASHRDRGGDTFSTLGARYDGKDLDAWAEGSHDSAADLSRLQAGFTYQRDGGPDWRGSFDGDTTGRWDANLGVSGKAKDGNLEWFAGVGAGRTATGERDVNAKAGLTWRF